MNMTQGTYDPEDRPASDELVGQVMDIIMDHMCDAIRLACIERARRKCMGCIMVQAQDTIDRFFKRHPPQKMEEIGNHEYMSLVVKFGRREAFRLLKEYQCESTEIDTDFLIDGNASCH
jgi:hypothetical protein